MMDQRFDELLQKYVSGTAAVEEQLELQAWYESKNQADVLWQADAADEERIVRDRLLTGITAMMQRSKPRSIRLWPRWIAAASVASAVLAGSYFYYTSNPTKQNTELAAVNDIAPGKESATLTLADGRKILINDALSGKIAEQSGVRISKTDDGEIIYEVVPDNSKILTYNTLTTTRGEQTRVRLPDGTLVFLNAESSLKYPTTFAGSAKRAVFLSGEGYFEVAKDKAHPFEVSTDDQKVQVLGTHFNINAYANNSATRTTLLEGSVRVENLAAEKSQILTPGQQSRVINSTMDIASVNIDEVTAWKDGVFMYDGETLENIMKDVSRWYNVEVEFTDPSLKKKSIYITANRFGHLSELLKPLGRTAKASFEIKENKIIIHK
ncbi:FecR family protein [Nubsella zeaxanthinifaciens]|uniref:FecR family protein n=1 Tax=Nubsella zeaxanthinifaciens TaxID=392412 RepID=UPI003D059772